MSCWLVLFSALILGSSTSSLSINAFVIPPTKNEANILTAPLQSSVNGDGDGEYYPKIVGVAGATGKTGQLVVQDLLSRGCKVKAIVRNVTKADEVLSPSMNNVMTNNDNDAPALEVIECDFTNENELTTAVTGCDAAIWCATGFSDTEPTNTKSDEGEENKPKKGIWNKIGSAFLNFFGVAEKKEENTSSSSNTDDKPATPKVSIDDIGLPAISKAFTTSKEGGSDGSSSSVVESVSPPKIVMLSSAGVTRPSWDDNKKEMFKGCADIPIVRLNPFGILDIKAASEEKLRQTGVDYCIFRPCGLNDDWPSGSRPIISQGDVAVGRINRKDVAKILCDVLSIKEASGKTFEAVTIEGYSPGDSSSSISSSTMSRLQLDKDGPIPIENVAVSYSLMQQLLPGEKQDAASLAMGQTYEQLDKDETGRLGKRGEEKVDGVVPVPTS